MRLIQPDRSCFNTQLASLTTNSTPSYVGGKQETWTGKAGWKDRGLTLATKHYPHAPGQHKPELLKAALTTSLQELQTDCVDIFYLHAADRSVPFKETLQAVNELHKEGRFVNLGLSNFTSFEVAEVCLICKENGWVRPTVWQGKLIASFLQKFAVNIFRHV